MDDPGNGHALIKNFMTSGLSEGQFVNSQIGSCWGVPGNHGALCGTPCSFLNVKMNKVNSITWLETILVRENRYMLLMHYKSITMSSQ